MRDDLKLNAFRVFALGNFIAIGGLIAFGQPTSASTIAGTERDPLNVAVDGAQVTITNLANDQAQRTLTHAADAYR
ncbi:MAG TPA: hypothetical protein VH639_08870 [Bryobacteraceae bacterium]|jgi:hypothetical protein